MGSNAEYGHHKAMERIAELEAQVERLSTPVTDAEIDAMCSEFMIDPVLAAHLALAVDALMEARKGAAS